MKRIIILVISVCLMRGLVGCTNAEAVPGDRRPMILVEDTLYLDANKAILAMLALLMLILKMDWR